MNQTIAGNFSADDSQDVTDLPAGKRVAFVQACWHKDIVDRARASFVRGLSQHGITEDRIDLFKVPGSLEIPLQVKLLAKSGRYVVIVAAGLIVDGGIYRHEFVSETVISAMMQVQLETEVPILSLVLTPQSFHEHNDHKRFFQEHMQTKGLEAAAACFRTLQNLKAFAY